MVAAVLVRHIVDDLAAAAVAEIDIKIGHAHPLGIQTALEQQPVLHRVHVGDAEQIRDETAHAAAASRTDRDAARLGVPHEIRHNKEIISKAH